MPTDEDEYEHQVVAIPPGQDEEFLLLTVTPSRWQIAEKFCVLLESWGYREARVLTVFLNEDDTPPLLPTGVAAEGGGE